jgi:hypothetical protein
VGGGGGKEEGGGHDLNQIFTGLPKMGGGEGGEMGSHKTDCFKLSGDVEKEIA